MRMCWLKGASGREGLLAQGAVSCKDLLVQVASGCEDSLLERGLGPGPCLFNKFRGCFFVF